MFERKEKAERSIILALFLRVGVYQTLSQECVKSPTLVSGWSRKSILKIFFYVTFEFNSKRLCLLSTNNVEIVKKRQYRSSLTYAKYLERSK